MTSTGTDIPAAIREFRLAGWSVAQIAADLGLHRSSIYRWHAGTRRPNPANFAALIQTVDMQYARENCRRASRPVVLLHLRAAAEALEDPAQREAFVAEMRAKRAEIVARRARFEQGRSGRRLARQRQPVVSVVAQVADPFDVVDQPEPLGVFG